MRNIQKLKSYLKDTAKKIKETRLNLKNSQRGIYKDEPTWRLHVDLSNMVYEFRHHHIAYCELRGKSRVQIERKVKDNNEASESYIESIKEKYEWSPEEIEIYEARRAKNEEKAVA